MKTCIAYFSKTGNIKMAAEYLAQKIGAQLIPLVDKTNYKGFIGFMKGGYKASLSKSTDLGSALYEEISKYERIILATPVWAGKTTPTINAVLNNVDFKDKEVYVMTMQSDSDFGDADKREAFYKEIINKKGGKFVALYSLAGTSPGKPPREEEDIISQVDATVTIV
ncbi:MAG: hypothetical protein KAQ68_09670 [Clostridiales bacterium]|nr:hypothetical protein [Clostridiales bacterium]